MKFLLFDISNILYRTFFVNKNLNVEESTGLAHHAALMSMNKFYKQFKPDKVIITSDRSSWRKKYTASKECLSQVPYKGNRRQKMTPAEKRKFAIFIKHVEEFEEILHVHTSLPVLANEGLEADDLIAGFCQAYGEDGEDDIIIVSRDRDLAQLQGNGKDKIYTNITQYDPTTGKKITIESAIKDLLKIKDMKPIPFEHNNVEYFLFAKYLRGDTGDNVQSAFPGVRRTRINKAFADPYEKTNLLNESWKCGLRNKEFVVKDLVKEGELLMDLRQQPNDIRTRIFQTILDGMEDPGTFSYFDFMKWLGKHELKKISENLDRFVNLLSR